MTSASLVPNEPTVATDWQATIDDLVSLIGLERIARLRLIQTQTAEQQAHARYVLAVIGPKAFTLDGRLLSKYKDFGR